MTIVVPEWAVWLFVALHVPSILLNAYNIRLKRKLLQPRERHHHATSTGPTGPAIPGRKL